ncbi:MAG TPA: amidohydrolase [Acidimicrobiia bacterium]|nr:amidohydrolase [Acidimicrobiia bacterium]
MSADLLIRGGRVFTAHRPNPFTSAVAVTGATISALGAEAEDLVGPGTRIIELHGGMATPGFIDAHVHPGTSGLDLLRCHFPDHSDAEGAVRVIAEYATANHDAPWILGAGWRQSWFERGCPPKELIDRVVSDRPVLLENSDGHGAWVNSTALKIAGIGANTPDPPDGRIERLTDGSPQGTLHEGAIDLVLQHAPPNTVDDFTAGLARGQQELLRWGITGWQDANVGSELHEAYLRLADNGELTARVVAAMWWDRDRGLEQIEELIERRQSSGPRFAPTSVKLMLDGVAENFTGSMLEPYLDTDRNPTDNLGIDFIDPVELREIVSRLDADGFQCHFHAIGDGAVRNALDAIAAAIDANGRGENRHHIAHIQVVHPDDVPRFRELDTVANAQPLWACEDEYQTDLTIPFLGAERASWQYPFGSLVRAGARIGMGSDWGVSTANVMEQIDVAVTRTGDTGKTLNPSEAMDPIDALTAFTAGSAYINHAEETSGRIAVGMLADLAVLDRDPLADAPFRDVRVKATIVGGEVVYEEV